MIFLCLDKMGVFLVNNSYRLGLQLDVIDEGSSASREGVVSLWKCL